MKTIVENPNNPGDIIAEVKAGTLVCANNAKNWEVIGDWMVAQSIMDVSFSILGDDMAIDFPDSYPANTVHDLLEHFEHFNPK